MSQSFIGPPFNERIVHIRKAVRVKARGKIRKRTKNRDALCDATYVSLRDQDHNPDVEIYLQFDLDSSDRVQH
jgi:hypothetical protein